MKLNLGCGTDIRPGYVNIDAVALPGVELVHDLRTPLPYPADSVDEVLAINVLEHLESVSVLRDVHRVLRPGGVVDIQVPHFTSLDMFGDPTHRTFFSAATFEFFVAGGPGGYYIDGGFTALEVVRIGFPRRRLYFYNPMIEWLVNRSARMRGIYESSPLRVFPASTIMARLRK